MDDQLLKRNARLMSRASISWSPCGAGTTGRLFQPLTGYTVREMPQQQEDVFLCGVVEGFYHRPWTHDQRLDLFSDKMRRFGLNAYLYAPKDDRKHRALWRKPYDEAECARLRALIDGCVDAGVQFFYGVSPGLDISYSSAEDAADLHAKLKQVRRFFKHSVRIINSCVSFFVPQVASLGCNCFAILWDDIDNTLPPEDKRSFSSLAAAHVAVTNAAHAALGAPSNFLTCPVEYCANRADPSVARSQYLDTLGKGLRPEIGIFWTGSRVVPETITKLELVELGKVYFFVLILFWVACTAYGNVSQVLRRKPVIWDNLHANDYDQQRVFLGPYSGRDPDIIPHVRGVFTNPNCEYSANVPALFTLAAWSHCKESWNPVSAAELAIPHFLEEARRKTAVEEEDNDPGQADLTKDDVELLFHVFWLPHSHGPRGELLINEFKYLRDHANLVLSYSEDDSEDDEEDLDFLDSWMERASSFNNACKRFSRLCDKFSLIANRQLFFDLNAYLSNVQVSLSAANRFLRWIGLERCRKPLAGGPTLAGLPGGFAGDLQRIFPVKSNYEYPIRMLTAPADKGTHVLSFVERKDFHELKSRLIETFEEPHEKRFLQALKLGVFTEKSSVEVLRLDCDGQLKGVLAGSAQVDQISESLQALTEEEDEEQQQRQQFPWSLLEKNDSVISVSLSSDLLFTRTASEALRLLLRLLRPTKSPCVLMERSSSLLKQFLKAEGFVEAHRGGKFGLMTRLQREEKMEES